MKKSIRRYAKYSVFYGVLVVVLLWLLGFAIFILYAMQFKYVPDGQVQGIVVLTGGNNRIDTALQLLQKNPQIKLLISGVYKGVSPTKILGHLPPALHRQITLGYQAENTKENAAELVQWAHSQHLTHLLLITSFYHLPRSIFEIKNLDNHLDLIPYPVFPHQVTDSKVIVHTRAAWLVFIEYHKFIIVHLEKLLKGLKWIF